MEYCYCLETTGAMDSAQRNAMALIIGCSCARALLGLIGACLGGPLIVGRVDVSGLTSCLGSHSGVHSGVASVPRLGGGALGVCFSSSGETLNMNSLIATACSCARLSSLGARFGDSLIVDGVDVSGSAGGCDRLASLGACLGGLAIIALVVLGLAIGSTRKGGAKSRPVTAVKAEALVGVSPPPPPPPPLTPLSPPPTVEGAPLGVAADVAAGRGEGRASKGERREVVEAAI